jgi:hypothetical protein
MAGLPHRRRNTWFAVPREVAWWLRHQAGQWWATTDRFLERRSRRFSQSRPRHGMQAVGRQQTALRWHYGILAATGPRDPSQAVTCTHDVDTSLALTLSPLST